MRERERRERLKNTCTCSFWNTFLGEKSNGQLWREGGVDDSVHVVVVIAYVQH